MIIAVDFDGTLYRHGQTNNGLVEYLRGRQACGATVILWTCREGKRLSEAVGILRKAGFVPNWVNCNAPEGIQKLGHDSRKIYADLYIDDKATR